MTRRRIWAAAVALVIAALLVAGLGLYGYGYRPSRFDAEGLATYYRTLAVQPASRVERGAVEAGIQGAMTYLKRVSQQSGQFIYLLNTNPDVKVPREYSILRHAGTIYSMGMAQSVLPDPEAVDVMRRAVEFMRDCCFTRFDDPDMLGVWEPEAVVHRRGPPEYKLGGAGLALSALTSLANVAPAAVSAEEMRALARFGLFMQRWNGEFYGKHVPEQGGRGHPGLVMFYPGEMVLGWLMLQERDPSVDLIGPAVKALAFLARERATEGAAPTDHWALLATAQLFKLADRDGVDIPREALINHALQICHTILEDAYGPAPLAVLEGSLLTLGRGEVTATATRLEGMLAALTFLPPSHPITPHVESAVHRGMDFVLRSQIMEGPYLGGVPMAIAQLPVDAAHDADRFNRFATEIRIDYVQHGMSAMVQYAWWWHQQSPVRR